jgi:hypothetical protein
MRERLFFSLIIDCNIIFKRMNRVVNNNNWLIVYRFCDNCLSKRIGQIIWLQDWLISRFNWLKISVSLVLWELYVKIRTLLRFEWLSYGLILIDWRSLRFFGRCLLKLHSTELLKDVFDLFFLHFADHEAGEGSIRTITFSKNFLAARNAHSLRLQILSWYHYRSRLWRSEHWSLERRIVGSFYYWDRLWRWSKNSGLNRRWGSKIIDSRNISVLLLISENRRI